MALFGLGRQIWRPAGLIPCRLGWGVTQHRILKQVLTGDPLANFAVDREEIEIWKPKDVSRFVRRRKAGAFAQTVLRQALVEGDLTAQFIDGQISKEIPAWAWANQDRVKFVWMENRLPLDALLPDEWCAWSRRPCFLTRDQFSQWLRRQDFQCPTEIVELAPKEGPPSRVTSRLPKEQTYAPLCEAVSWLAFNVALGVDDFFELLQTGEIGDGIEWAERRVNEAFERLTDAIVAGEVRCIGRHRQSYNDNVGILTTELPPIVLVDYRRYDVVSDALLYGRGLNHRRRDSVLEILGGKGRRDLYSEVHVRRSDLLEKFALRRERAVRDTATRSGPRAAVGLGTLKQWLTTLGPTAESLGQDDLLAMARKRFRHSRVSREQIREITRGRKRGPKPIRGQSLAK